MPDLINLLDFESRKLTMATPPSVKHWLKRRVDAVLLDPALNEAAMIKAMKQVQQALELRLKSHPDAKAAMIGLLVTFSVLLRHELREMARGGHRPQTSREVDALLGHVNNVYRFASLLQPLLKGSYSVETEAILQALRRTH